VKSETLRTPRTPLKCAYPGEAYMDRVQYCVSWQERTKLDMLVEQAGLHELVPWNKLKEEFLRFKTMLAVLDWV
jgi:hypothetical protein